MKESTEDRDEGIFRQEMRSLLESIKQSAEQLVQSVADGLALMEEAEEPKLIPLTAVKIFELPSTVALYDPDWNQVGSLVVLRDGYDIRWEIHVAGIVKTVTLELCDAGIAGIKARESTNEVLRVYGYCLA